MMRLRIPLASAASFIVIAICTVRLAAAEPACELNYKTDGTTSETFVLTSLTPEAVVERLPWLLAKAGVTIHWTQPTKGIIEAEGLDVKAEKSGDATRVTFHSHLQPADRKTLCRYASLAGSPPEAKKAPVAQDPALIERMKNDLLKKHDIMLPTGKGLNNVQFSSPSNFLQFAVTDIKASPGKQEYKVSMLLPRDICSIAHEDMEDLSMGFSGVAATERRTKPVRVEASLVYEGEGAASHLADASIVTIESESTK